MGLLFFILETYNRFYAVLSDLKLKILKLKEKHLTNYLLMI